jgi:DNA-binding MarR family transcriptional regulator
MAQLSDTQLVVLSAASQRPDHSVYPLTVKLPGGAVAKVLGSLLAKGLIKEIRGKREDTVWREDKKRGRLTLRATPAALASLGVEGPETSADSETKPSSDKGKSPSKDNQPRTRTDSKQAKLIEMLKRPNGATVEEIVKKFEWQPHTVRGAIAGALKKKLGLKVTSEKVERRGRVYRIAG